MEWPGQTTCYCVLGCVRWRVESKQCHARQSHSKGSTNPKSDDDEDDIHSESQKGESF